MQHEQRIYRTDILLSSGRYFEFTDFSKNEFDVADIAYGLAHICRFSGHTREFYSVAQHSVLASRLVDREHAFAALMFDASKAFLGEIAKPLKELLPDYRTMKDSLERDLFPRFGLDYPLPAAIDRVKRMLRASEQRDLMPPHEEDWTISHELPLLSTPITPVDSQTAFRMFMQRYDELRAEGLVPSRPGHVTAASAGEGGAVHAPYRTDILTKSGRYFDFVEPRDNIFDISDIGFGLANVCRFGGHTRQFYSVAQHSVLASELVPPAMAFAALVHDGAEAFMGDVAKPLKELLANYKVIEERVERDLFPRLGLSYPLDKEIKRIDLVLLATELRDLMPAVSDEWPILRGIAPLDRRIVPLGPKQAYDQFMERFQTLARQGLVPNAALRSAPQWLFVHGNAA